MAADLHIHIYENLTENDMIIFFRNYIGSKYSRMTPIFDSLPESPTKKQIEQFKNKIIDAEEQDRAFNEEMKKQHLNRDIVSEKMSNTPNIWVGEVSWLKAAFCENGERFVPSPIMKISELIDENLPVIDDHLIGQIVDAMKLSNTTGYSLEHSDNIRNFLEQHKGKQCFTISW